MGKGLLALGAALALSCASAPASAGWWDDLDKGERVRLADLVAQPRPWAGKRVTFTCVFHKQDQVYAPYFTRFHPGRHLNLSVWTDGAPVWEQPSFLSDFPHLYLDRSHVQRDEILAFPAFTRIEVTGEVRDVYRNAPWIEVHGVRRTGGTLGDSVVHAMMSGDNHLRAAEPSKAEAWYRRALRDPGLDETYAMRIRKRLGDLLRANGRADEAADVEGGTIVGGTLLPRSDGSVSAYAPPPPVEEPAVAPPAAVTEALPGIPVDVPVAAPRVAALPPPAPTREPAPEPEAAPAAPPAPVLAAPRVAEAAVPAVASDPGPEPAAPAPVPAGRPATPPAPPRRVPRLAGVQ